MTMRKSRSAIAATALVGCIGVATAEVGVPVPLATLIPGTTYCVVEGWEYAARWSIPGNGFISESLEACAIECELDPACTGATFIAEGTDDNNCWFKNWTGAVAPPCLPAPENPLVYQAIIDPAGADCGSIVYMDEPVYGCEEEMLLSEKPGLEAAVAPMLPSTVTDLDALAALTPPYTAYPGVDYSPVQDPLPVVGVEDLGPGLVVEDAVECATLCSEDPLCNAASYYGDNPQDIWPGGFNCYLKVLDGCVLPDDHAVTGDATIFMIGGAVCADGPVAAPLALPPLTATSPVSDLPALAPPALGPSPAAEFAPAPAVPPLSTDQVGTDRAFEPTGAGVTSETGSTGGQSITPSAPSGSQAILPGLTAAAAAVIVALL